jgi:hypothetical protein
MAANSVSASRKFFLHFSRQLMQLSSSDAIAAAAGRASGAVPASANNVVPFFDSPRTSQVYHSIFVWQWSIFYRRRFRLP